MKRSKLQKSKWIYKEFLQLIQRFDRHFSVLYLKLIFFHGNSQITSKKRQQRFGMWNDLSRVICIFSLCLIWRKFAKFSNEVASYYWGWMRTIYDNLYWPSPLSCARKNDREIPNLVRWSRAFLDIQQWKYPDWDHFDMILRNSGQFRLNFGLVLGPIL